MVPRRASCVLVSGLQGKSPHAVATAASTEGIIPHRVSLPACLGTAWADDSRYPDYSQAIITAGIIKTQAAVASLWLVLRNASGGGGKLIMPIYTKYLSKHTHTHSWIFSITTLLARG